MPELTSVGSSRSPAPPNGLGVGVRELPPTGWSVFHEAAATGDATIFAALLRTRRSSEPDINSVCGTSESPLSLACGNLFVDIVRLLLEAGAAAPPITLFRLADIGLSGAALEARADDIGAIVALLLAAHVDANARDERGCTALHRAVARFNYPLVAALAHSSRVSLAAVDADGFTALHYAADRGDVHVVSLLMAAGANVNAPAPDTPLHLAAHAGAATVARALLDGGARVLPGVRGYLPLHVACLFGYLPLVEILTPVCPVNHAGADGAVAAHFAAATGEPNVLRALVAAGASMAACDMDGHNAAHYAASHGRVHALKVLVGVLIEPGSEQTSPSARAQAAVLLAKANVRGELPVHLAALSGHLDVMNYLLEVMRAAGLGPLASLLATDGTPLHYAAIGAHVVLAIELVRREPDLALLSAVAPSTGDTALHAAARLKTPALVVALIEEVSRLTSAVPSASTGAEAGARAGAEAGPVAGARAGAGAATSPVTLSPVAVSGWTLPGSTAHSPKLSPSAAGGWALSGAGMGPRSPSHSSLPASPPPRAALATGPLAAFLAVRNLAGWTALQHATQVRSHRCMDAILRAGADPDATVPGVPASLLIAVRHSDMDAAILLLAASADPSVRDAHGFSALAHAAFRDDASVAALLLRAGADPNAVSDRESGALAPLHVAVLARALKVVRLLVRGPTAGEPTGGGPNSQRVMSTSSAGTGGGFGDVSTAPHGLGLPSEREQATRSIDKREPSSARPGTVRRAGSLVAITRYLAQMTRQTQLARLPIEPYLLTADGADALHLAVFVRGADDALVDVLALSGYDLNRPVAGGLTLAHEIAAMGDPALLPTLAARGLLLAKADNDGNTPLHHATYHGNDAAVATLLRLDAPANIAAADGRTPLHLALVMGAHACFELLVDASAACIATADAKGQQPLHVAIRHARLDAVPRLLRAGADVNAPEPLTGATPLHLAIAARSESMVAALLAAGAALDMRDLAGNTVAHAAAAAKLESVAQTVLLASGGGSLMTLRNSAGLRPLDVARASGHAGIVRVMQPFAPADTRSRANSTRTISAGAQGLSPPSAARAVAVVRLQRGGEKEHSRAQRGIDARRQGRRASQQPPVLGAIANGDNPADTSRSLPIDAIETPGLSNADASPLADSPSPSLLPTALASLHGFELEPTARLASRLPELLSAPAGDEWTDAPGTAERACSAVAAVFAPGRVGLHPVLADDEAVSVRYARTRRLQSHAADAVATARLARNSIDSVDGNLAGESPSRRVLFAGLGGARDVMAVALTEPVDGASPLAPRARLVLSRSDAQLIEQAGAKQPSPRGTLRARAARVPEPPLQPRASTGGGGMIASASRMGRPTTSAGSPRRLVTSLSTTSTPRAASASRPSRVVPRELIATDRDERAELGLSSSSALDVDRQPDSKSAAKPPTDDSLRVRELERTVAQLQRQLVARDTTITRLRVARPHVAEINDAIRADTAVGADARVGAGAGAGAGTGTGEGAGAGAGAANPQTLDALERKRVRDWRRRRQGRKPEWQ